jgi:hypothetical protein
LKIKLCLKTFLRLSRVVSRSAPCWSLNLRSCWAPSSRLLGSLILAPTSAGSSKEASDHSTRSCAPMAAGVSVPSPGSISNPQLPPTCQAYRSSELQATNRPRKSFSLSRPA